MQTIIYIFPELFLSFSIMALLMIGFFFKKSFKLVNSLTIISLIFANALVLNQHNETIKIFNGSYIIDIFSTLMKTITLLFSIFVLFSSREYLKINNIEKIEYPILILSSILGMILMISSYDLIIYYFTFSAINYLPIEFHKISLTNSSNKEILTNPEFVKDVGWKSEGGKISYKLIQNQNEVLITPLLLYLY